MCVDKWNKKTIEIQWLSGNAQFLDAHRKSPHAKFTLTRNCDNKGKYRRYDVSFCDGDMLWFWKGVWLLDVPGEYGHPCPPVRDLPEWKAKDDSIRKVWDDTLNPIAGDMRRDKRCYDCLQGYLPIIVTETGEPQVDRVRMLYLDQAIKRADGGTDDLVLVVLRLADSSRADAHGPIRVHEDGAGGGPPR